MVSDADPGLISAAWADHLITSLRWRKSPSIAPIQDLGRLGFSIIATVTRPTRFHCLEKCPSVNGTAKKIALTAATAAVVTAESIAAAALKMAQTVVDHPQTPLNAIE